MNAKRIHPTPYHQHNGAFRAETARYEGELPHQDVLFGLRQVGLQNDAGVLSLKAR
jgi:hypothetical protein